MWKREAPHVLNNEKDSQNLILKISCLGQLTDRDLLEKKPSLYLMYLVRKFLEGSFVDELAME